MLKRLSLLTIVLLSVLFRLYNLSGLFHWTMDEEYWSYIPYNIVTGYHFPLIGGSIAATGLYSGPLFVYLMSIPAFLFRGYPLGFGLTVSLLGVLTSVLIFLFGRRMFNSKVAFIASFLYSASFLMAIFDRHYWNASLTPILSLLVLYSLFQIISKKKYLYLICLSGTLALAIQSHGTGMALILFSLLSCLVFRVNLKSKWVLFSVILFVLLQLPLVIFDLRHNLLNTRAALSYSAKPANVDLPDKFEKVAIGFLSASSRFAYFPAKDLNEEQSLCPLYQKTPPVPIITLLAIVLITFGAALAIKKNSIAGCLSALLIASTFVGLVFFKGPIAEYYYNPTFIPGIFLVSLVSLVISRNKFGTIFLSLVLGVYYSLNLLNLLNARRAYNFNDKINAVRQSLNLVGNKAFSLTVEATDPCQIYGFRYLYTYLGHEPVKSYMDPYFLWFYENRLPKRAVEKDVILTVNEGPITITTSDSEASQH